MGDMADEGTFEYTLGGRSIQFKRTEPPQVMMLQRYVSALQAKMQDARASGDNDGYVIAMKQINEAVWTAVESRFADPSDVQWVQLQVISGGLDETDLLPVLSNGEKATQAPDDADPPAPKKRVPAKKAASVKKTSLNRRAR